jgi:hypothetical protein
VWLSMIVMRGLSFFGRARDSDDQDTTILTAHTQV